jgi:hypothetical protein
VEAVGQVGSVQASVDGSFDNQPGGFRIFNLRKRKRKTEVVPEGRWDLEVAWPTVEAEEVPASETIPIEPINAPARVFKAKIDHSRWITVPAVALRVKVPKPKPIEEDDDHALRLLLLLAS